MWICSYCGNEADESKRLAGCCGEVHFDEVEVCPNCGEGLGILAHYKPVADGPEPECNYLFCEECGHQWRHE